MREICTSGSVGGEGGNLLAYPALFDIVRNGFVWPKWQLGSFRQNGSA